MSRQLRFFVAALGVCLLNLSSLSLTRADSLNLNNELKTVDDLKALISLVPSGVKKLAELDRLNALRRYQKIEIKIGDLKPGNAGTYDPISKSVTIQSNQIIGIAVLTAFHELSHALDPVFDLMEPYRSDKIWEIIQSEKKAKTSAEKKSCSDRRLQLAKEVDALRYGTEQLAYSEEQVFRQELIAAVPGYDSWLTYQEAQRNGRFLTHSPTDQEIFTGYNILPMNAILYPEVSSRVLAWDQERRNRD